MEPADVHPPRDLHCRVLGRVQAHGDGPEHATIICFEAAKHVLGVRLLGVAREFPRAAPFRISGSGPVPNAKASTTTRAADVHGRC